jgi:hypothetical protein
MPRIIYTALAAQPVLPPKEQPLLLSTNAISSGLVLLKLYSNVKWRNHWYPSSMVKPRFIILKSGGRTKKEGLEEKEKGEENRKGWQEEKDEPLIDLLNFNYKKLVKEK